MRSGLRNNCDFLYIIFPAWLYNLHVPVGLFFILGHLIQLKEDAVVEDQTRYLKGTQF